MAKSVIIKLTTAGTSVGPFNMLSDADSYAAPFETNISRATLVTGYTSSLVPNAATIIRALSSGSCTNYVDLYITSSVPTTTTTTTTTTTSTTTTTTTAVPTTSTTTTTTTAAPTTTTSTTTTTTTAVPTTSTTTTTTTAAPTTTTSTTTTTTTALFQGYVSYALSDTNACTNPISGFTMTGNGTTFCNSTIFSSGGWYSVASNTYYLSYGGNTLTVNHYTLQNSASLTGGGCQACPATTTTTTTTAAPTTSTTTTTTTAAPTTSTTTTTTTAATTSTTTTTTTAAPTTTTSTTTTTTTADPYDYYLADEYYCIDCSFQTGSVAVAFPAGTSIVTLNRYYRPSDPTGFIYKNFTSTTPGVSIIMTTTGNSLNCNTICGNTTTTTTTTTTTAAPTTSTTTTTTTIPVYSYCTGYDASNCCTAITDYTNNCNL